MSNIDQLSLWEQPCCQHTVTLSNENSTQHDGRRGIRRRRSSNDLHDDLHGYSQCLQSPVGSRPLILCIFSSHALFISFISASFVMSCRPSQATSRWLCDTTSSAADAEFCSCFSVSTSACSSLISRAVASSLTLALLPMCGPDEHTSAHSMSHQRERLTDFFANITVCDLPPRLSFNSQVSSASRYDT